MKMRFVLLSCAALALTVGIGTATAGGGNSGAAQQCQQGGWQNLVRQDGTAFKNQGDCVSYAAQGGVLKPKSTCTTGSENFSEFGFASTPTVFSGGTIDPADYAPSPAWDPSFPAGGILLSGPYFNGFASNTHFLFTGIGVNSAKLTFTNAVNSVQLQAETDKTGITTTLTLTGYDASNQVVATGTGTDIGTGVSSATPQINSTTNNIKSFTIATDDPNIFGLGFSNIVWGCAS